MESFVICKNDSWIHMENIVKYQLHPSFSIRALRLSPHFIYSSEYGYLKSWDEITKEPIMMEEKAKKDFEWSVEIVHKNGCHVSMEPKSVFPNYFYTLPYKAKIQVIAKKNGFFQLSTGGWASQFITNFVTKKREKIFRFFPFTQPILVRVTNALGATVIQKDGQVETLEVGKILKATGKCFEKIPFLENKGGVEGDVEEYPVLMTEKGNVLWKDVALLGRPVSAEASLERKEGISGVPVCQICMNHPINTNFIHGDFSHSFCCHSCSEKLLSQTCPVCRLPIEKVVLNYIVS